MPKLGEFTERDILEKARNDYDHGEARFPLYRDKAALLVVDMLDEFVKPQWTPYWVPEATRQAPRIRILQDACRRLKVPVINIGYETSLWGLNFPNALSHVPIGAGSSEFIGQIFTELRFYHEVAPQAEDLVLLKHAYSAFHNTELETVLRNLGRDTVIIAGTMTNYCCGATAREAYWHGFRVVFGSDVNSSDDEECQRAELRTLRRGYARVLSADQIVAELERNAGQGP